MHMLQKELYDHSHHYSLLIVLEAFLLSAFIVVEAVWLRILVALSIGILYALWGIYAHKGQLTTVRLVLEYALVGLLASTMLIVLISNT